MKVTIVTGASSGIGKEITKKLLSLNYKVIGVSRSIKQDDFKDKNLWLLSENLKKLYKTKLDLLNKKMQSLKLSERMKLAGIIKELRKKESYLTNHFLKNKKGGKSTENGKSNQSNISNEIGLFKNHPLYHYMQLGGHQALSIALNFVEPLCRTTDFINTDKCKLERQQLVNNLKDKGFSNLSVNDFKDDRLWKIQNNLRLLYIEKMRDINANVRNTPIKERWDAKQPARELRAKLKSLTEQLVQNRIQ